MITRRKFVSLTSVGGLASVFPGKPRPARAQQSIHTTTRMLVGFTKCLADGRNGAIDPERTLGSKQAPFAGVDFAAKMPFRDPSGRHEASRIYHWTWGRLDRMKMRFRVVTLNLEQDHKRWDERRPLVLEGLRTLKPDIIALNEVSITRQSARGLQKDLASLLGANHNLVQQTKANSVASVEGEALLTRFAIAETGNLDYQTRDMVAQVTRILVDGRPLDVYVTHLYMSRGDDALRLFQVQQLLAWIDTRSDVSDCIVCGDFNATLDMPSAALMASRFRPTQTAPTAFTPLAGRDGAISHPCWPRMDRCIDYIWTTGAIETVASGVCFDQPAANDPSLWPSDHAGVWADLEF